MWKHHMLKPNLQKSTQKKSVEILMGLHAINTPTPPCSFFWCRKGVPQPNDMCSHQGSQNETLDHLRLGSSHGRLAMATSLPVHG